MIRDYYSIPILEKHWSLFDEVHLYEITEHWKQYQTEKHLILNNEGISILINYDEEMDEFNFIVFKRISIIGMFYIKEEKDDKSIIELGEYYFSSMLTSKEREEMKAFVINTFRISYGVKHFASTEIKIVHDKNRKGNMGKGFINKGTADSGLIVPVNIIDSSYLRTSIHVDATSVRGHFMLQPCGKLNHDRKLIWIDTSEKGSYKRIANN